MSRKNKKSNNKSWKYNKNVNKVKQQEIDNNNSSSNDDLEKEVCVERDVVSSQRKLIKKGRGAAIIIERHGEAGMEEYFVGHTFMKILFDKNVLGVKLENELDDAQYNKLICKYYKISSEKENPIGQFALAQILIKGQYGQTIDEEHGVKLMLKSSKSGCGPALFNHGTWLLEGKKGFERNPFKAHKLFTKAKNDPVLAGFKDERFSTNFNLFRMRFTGVGNVKSYSAALKHLREAAKVKEDKVDSKIFTALEAILELSGVEIQRESDIRHRRLRVAGRGVSYLPISEWIKLYSYFGFGLSKQPSKEDAKVSMTQGNYIRWMYRVGAKQVLLDEYRAMDEPLPPVECDRRGCFVTEETMGKELKKCSSCQAPYCSVSCQRADWSCHRPVCEEIARNMLDTGMKDYELKLLRQMGINEDDENWPIKEKGTSLLKEHSTVTRNLTQRHQELTNAAGLRLPEEPGEAEKQDVQQEQYDEPNAAANIIVSLDELEPYDGSEVRNTSEALSKELYSLRKIIQNDDLVAYVLFTPDSEEFDVVCAMPDVESKVLFKSMWGEVINVPWRDPTLRSKTLWLMYVKLALCLPNERYWEMLRSQLQAEFGVDPYEAKESSGL